MMNSKMIASLQELYEIFNEKLFGGILPKANISITYNLKPSKKENLVTLGYFCNNITWEDSEGNPYVCVNITADCINEGFYEVVGTLIHEQCHVFNHQQGVIDIKGRRKHTEEFKDVAEMAQLVVKSDKAVGWGVTSISNDLMDIINDLDIDKSIFDAHCNIEFPQIEEKEKKPKEKYIYMCPKCKDKMVRSKKHDMFCVPCKVNYDISLKE